MPGRLLIVLLLLWAVVSPAAIRVYLKDGTWQPAREYKVLEDRIRYYSTERSQWEEIPLDLIDLKRTRAEQAESEAERAKEVEILAAEDRAEREAAEQIDRIPPEPGLYWINGKNLTAIAQAETKINSNKRRSILKVITPLPVIAGKSTVEIDGETAETRVTGNRPEFYLRLNAPERFALVRLKVQKGVRIVENWSIMPVTNEIMQEHEAIEIFRHQVGDGLYKIWPQKPIEAGEYAVIEFTEGKGNTQTWDFSLKGGA